MDDGAPDAGSGLSRRAVLRGVVGAVPVAHRPLTVDGRTAYGVAGTASAAGPSAGSPRAPPLRRAPPRGITADPTHRVNPIRPIGHEQV